MSARAWPLPFETESYRTIGSASYHKERISYNHTVCNRTCCVYHKACSCPAQSRLGNYQRDSCCHWNARAVDHAVYRRLGIPCGPAAAPCTVGSVSLAGFERKLRI